MAEACKEKGLKYMVVTDHSRSAFYAGGLSIERVEMQWREIDSLNQSFSDFKIVKGIESDILNDGSLDYPDDILAGFDVVIASVHTNLRMDIEKATQRIISAIENKYTTILGHPTGRLLLSREGYSLDFKKVIDACSSNGVSIELNSNPQRLDLDYSWLEYCMQKNVQISINPDAHSIGQLEYLKYGVLMARKGGLETKFCWNAKMPPFVK
jgi:DNA polymerase (family 10)